jgi:hypothetical protein
VKKGLDALIDRYEQAVAHLDELRVIPDPMGTNKNSLSCFESADTILTFMSPTPHCWFCFLENRGPWLPYMWDHNAIVCASAASPQQIVVFDWFGGRSPACSYEWFTMRYPTTINTYPNERAARPSAACSSDSPWKPDFETMDVHIRKVQANLMPTPQ